MEWFYYTMPFLLLQEYRKNTSKSVIYLQDKRILSKKTEKRLAITIFICYTLRVRSERWLSGLKRTTGNRVSVDSASRVQIPISPPKKDRFLSRNLSFLVTRLRRMKNEAGLCPMKRACGTRMDKARFASWHNAASCERNECFLSAQSTLH